MVAAELELTQRLPGGVEIRRQEELEVFAGRRAQGAREIDRARGAVRVRLQIVMQSGAEFGGPEVALEQLEHGRAAAPVEVALALRSRADDSPRLVDLA